MELRQLRHFVAVADTLNFRRAAESVHLSQQAVSKSILQLEEQIGLKLLDRNRQSVSLTAFGQLLLPHARTILAEVQRFEDVLADTVGRKFGQLKIGASPTLLDDIVPTTLHLFNDRHPQIRVLVERGDFARLQDRLLQGEIDVILSIAPEETQSDLVALETMSSDHNVIVVRSGHPLTGITSLNIGHLATYARIGIHNFRRADEYLARLFGLAGEPVPQPVVKTTSAHFAQSWIQRNDHWLVGPQRLVSRALRDGTLVALEVALIDDSWPLIIATRRHATRSPAVLAYTEIVRAFIGTA